MYPAIEEFFIENEEFFNSDTKRFLRNTSQMYLTATKNTGFLYIVSSYYLLDILSVKKPADFQVDYEVFANSTNSKFNDINDLVNQMYNYKEKIEIQTQPSFFIVENSSNENSISKMYKPLMGSWKKLKNFNTAIAKRLKKIYKNIWSALEYPPPKPSGAPPLSPLSPSPPSPPVSVAKFFELAEKNSTVSTTSSPPSPVLPSSPTAAVTTASPASPGLPALTASPGLTPSTASPASTTLPASPASPASPGLTPSTASTATIIPALADVQPNTPIVTTVDLTANLLQSDLVIIAKALKTEIETLIEKHAKEISDYNNDNNVKINTENYEVNNTTKNNSLQNAAKVKTKKIIKVIETAVQIINKKKKLNKKIIKINTTASTDNIQNTNEIKLLLQELIINTDNIVNETKTKKENFEKLNENVINLCKKKCKTLIANNSFNSNNYKNNENVKKFIVIIRQAPASTYTGKKK